MCGCVTTVANSNKLAGTAACAHPSEGGFVVGFPWICAYLGQRRPRVHKYPLPLLSASVERSRHFGGIFGGIAVFGPSRQCYPAIFAGAQDISSRCVGDPSFVFSATFAIELALKLLQDRYHLGERQRLIEVHRPHGRVITLEFLHAPRWWCESESPRLCQVVPR